MIASVTGSVRAIGLDWIVVDVNGVGYRVVVTPSIARNEDIGNSVDFVTSLVVREDSMTLYGFVAAEELNLFESLITVTGVGPRSAMAILAALSPADIFSAVAQEDESAFKKVSGVGPKTAKLIIVQLSGKLSAALALGDASTPSASPKGQKNTRDEQVIAALVGLGWSARVVTQSVAELNLDDDLSVAQALRLSLAALSTGGAS